MSSVAAQLRAARALIADPAHWCQHAYVLTAAGEVCEIQSQRAARFCAVGALYRRADPIQVYWGLALLYRAARDRFGVRPDLVNDEFGHAAVLQLYDDAIAMAEPEAAEVPS